MFLNHPMYMEPKEENYKQMTLGRGCKVKKLKCENRRDRRHALIIESRTSD